MQRGGVTSKDEQGGRAKSEVEQRGGAMSGDEQGGGVMSEVEGYSKWSPGA